MSSKAARWLDLIAFLLHRRYPVSRSDIFAQVSGYRIEGGGRLPDVEGQSEEGKVRSRRAIESVRRKFERDKGELRSLGIEIETVHLPGGDSEDSATGYRLAHRDFYLPYLELSEQEVRERPYQGLHRIHLDRREFALLDRATARLAERRELPLSAEVHSARRKLAFDLPIAMDRIERSLARPVSAESEKALAFLQEATARYRAVRCRYYSIGRDSEEERVLEPYGLFFTWSQWYLAARPRNRDDVRVFRVDRMREVEIVAGPEAEFSVPKDFDIDSLVGRAPWEIGKGPPEAVRVRFLFPDSRWILAQRAGTPVETMLEDGSAVIDFAARDRGPLLRWLLTFQGQVEVLSPSNAAEDLRSLRNRVRTLYG